MLHIIFESLVVNKKNRGIMSWSLFHLQCSCLMKLCALDFNHRDSCKSIIAKNLTAFCQRGGSAKIIMTSKMVNGERFDLKFGTTHPCDFPRNDKSSNQLSRCALI